MKLEIWCNSGYRDKRHYHAVHAKTVEWPVVPRVGEYIAIHDGYCSEEVLAVHHDFDAGSCEVQIGPDYEGTYAEKAAPQAGKGKM